MPFALSRVVWIWLRWLEAQTVRRWTDPAQQQLPKLSWWWVLGLTLGNSDVRADANYLLSLKPALREHCFACHGALQQKAKLRLDTVAAMLLGGKSGPAIDPAHPDQSLLLHRVTAAEVTERMPPEHEGQPLPASIVLNLREWIAQGAPAPASDTPELDPRQHWSFQPCVRPLVPRGAGPAEPHYLKWIRNPIDAFIAQGHAQMGLSPQPEASAAVWLRRIYFDLVGEPPTPADLDSFEQDRSSNRDDRTVDRLLADPRHGERWARHWMDIWRYSDWWGLGDQLRNSQKHIWHWRDWMVESLNANVPYDEMIRLMLAADESHPGDLQKLRATGFLARNYFLFNRNQWMDETVEHVGKAFLGLTLNCAKCHDHKYDPLAQTDYYRFRAIFEPYHVRLDLVPGEADLERDGIPSVFEGPAAVPTYRFIRGQENQPDKSVLILPGIPEALAFRPLEIQPVQLPVEAWQPERRSWVTATYRHAARQKLQGALDAQEKLLQKHPANGNVESPEMFAEQKLAEAAVALARAEGASVEERVQDMELSWKLGALPPGTVDPSSTGVDAERKVALAKAEHAVAETELRLLQATAEQKGKVEAELKTARANSDTARRSLTNAVGSTNTLALLAGAKWTPTRFLSSERDDPVVPFATNSTGRRSALAAWMTNSRNPLTARVAVNHIWARHFGTPLVATSFDFGRKGSPPSHPELLDWLAVELMESGWNLKHLHRLIVSSATYHLSSSAANAPTNLQRDPDNRFWWRREPIRLESQAVRDALLTLAGTLDPTPGGAPVPPSEQANSYRRSLYFFHSNNERNLFLTTFDEAGVKECYRREQSIIPQQALALSNSRLVQEASRHIAHRLSREVGDLATRPLRDEAFVRSAFRVLLAITPNQEERDACLRSLAEWRQLAGDAPADPEGTDPARAALIWALLNHNDFVTLR